MEMPAATYFGDRADQPRSRTARCRRRPIDDTYAASSPRCSPSGLFDKTNSGALTNNVTSAAAHRDGPAGGRGGQRAAEEHRFRAADHLRRPSRSRSSVTTPARTRMTAGNGSAQRERALRRHAVPGHRDPRGQRRDGHLLAGLRVAERRAASTAVLPDAVPGHRPRPLRPVLQRQRAGRHPDRSPGTEPDVNYNWGGAVARRPACPPTTGRRSTPAPSPRPPPAPTRSR